MKPSLNPGNLRHSQTMPLATGQDRNSVLVDYDIFVNVPPLDARDSESLQTLYDAADLDFRLRSGSAAIDRAMPYCRA